MNRWYYLKLLACASGSFALAKWMDQNRPASNAKWAQSPK